jgi:hypothetical protein
MPKSLQSWVPGFDPSILEHSGICLAADEAVMNDVPKKILKNAGQLAA